MENLENTLKFEIVTPEQCLHEDIVSQVVLPAVHGMIGILPKHAPMILGLKPGVIDVYRDDSIVERVFVGGGFAHIDEKRCTVMADEGIYVSDIKRSEVEKYIKEVQTEMKEAREEDEKEMLQKTLTVANAKLELLTMLKKGGSAEM